MSLKPSQCMCCQGANLTPVGQVTGDDIPRPRWRHEGGLLDRTHSCDVTDVIVCYDCGHVMWFVSEEWLTELRAKAPKLSTFEGG